MPTELDTYKGEKNVNNGQIDAVRSMRVGPSIPACSIIVSVLSLAIPIRLDMYDLYNGKDLFVGSSHYP